MKIAQHLFAFGVCAAAMLSQSHSASASTCSDASPETLVSTPYASHWDAYYDLVCLEENLIVNGDRRAVFTSVYTLTTLRMAEAIDSGLFQDTAWMQTYQTEFANHFRQAFYDYETGNYNAVPDAWVIAFDEAESGQSLLIQDALLGMNAHINYDLAFAVEAVGISPNRSTKYADHTLVNDVLGEVSDELLAALNDIYGPNYAALDAALGPVDELILSVGMSAARQNAWVNAVSLTNSRWWNRWLVKWYMNSAAVTSAYLVTAPIPGPLMTLLKQLEGTNPGSTFCDNFPCSY